MDALWRSRDDEGEGGDGGGDDDDSTARCLVCEAEGNAE